MGRILAIGAIAHVILAIIITLARHVVHRTENPSRATCHDVRNSSSRSCSIRRLRHVQPQHAHECIGIQHAHP